MSSHSSSIRAFFIFKVFYHYVIVKEKRQEIIGKKRKLPPSEKGKGQSQQLIRGVSR